MYSHRLIAFAIFTSLFFTSSALFAGLTWFLISLRFSNSSVGDDTSHGTPKTLPQSETTMKREPSEDDEIMTSADTYLPISRVSRSDNVTQSAHPVTDIVSQIHQVHRGQLSSDSSTSARDGDGGTSTITNIKMEEDTTSLDGETGDDDTETIE